MRRVLALAAIVLIAACDEDIAGTGCRADADCPSDAVCVDAICFTRCSVESPCPGGKTCDGGRCVATGGQDCQTDAQCGKCLACRSGSCVPQAAGEDVKNDCASEACFNGVCDGAGACAIAAAGTVCRGVAGECDTAETCSGQSGDCPADAFEPATKECRPAAGDCDVEERCSGTAAECPADEFEPATKVCRQAADECDLEDKCTGQDAVCGADAKQEVGYECGAASCSAGTALSRRTCDAAGVCSAAVQTACAPYICGATSCRQTCDSNADCTTGLCDLRTHECAATVKSVDCAASAGALQAEISQCVAGTTCYLSVRGTCDKIAIQDRSVYIDGGGVAVVAPSSAGPALVIEENDTTRDETTKVAIVGLAIRGASGPVGHGIQVTGVTGGSPEVVLRHATIGGPNAGESNSGGGISASNAHLVVDASTIQNNVGGGISASNARLAVVASTIQNNVGVGLAVANAECAACLTSLDRTRVLANVGGGAALRQTAFSVTNSVFALNGLSTAPSAFGGVRILEPGSAHFVHNTVTGNGLTGKYGIECGLGSVEVLNTIVWSNGSTAADEVVGCGSVTTGSHIEGSPAQSCGSNSAPSLTADYHLLPNSPCIDKAPDCSGLTTDVDGDARPLIPNGRCDVGADEAR